MDLNNLKDKIIALVVWNVDKKDDVHVYVGSLISQGTEYIFKNEKKGWTVPIQADKVDDIKKVPDNLKPTLLNADYFINLTIGDMVDNQGDFIPTGLKWHN